MSDAALYLLLVLLEAALYATQSATCWGYDFVQGGPFQAADCPALFARQQWTYVITTSNTGGFLMDGVRCSVERSSSNVWGTNQGGSGDQYILQLTSDSMLT
jgi:hypothetical protein